MPGELGWPCSAHATPLTPVEAPSPSATCWAGGQRLASAAAGLRGAPGPPPACLCEHNEA